jgi:hypothetical protein
MNPVARRHNSESDGYWNQMHTLREILDAANSLPKKEKTTLLQELLNVRADRPLHVVLKDCSQIAEERFQHIFTVTNWTDETVVVSSLIDWLKDADAGTVGHQVLLCAPKSTFDLKLEFRFHEVKIKLKGYILPSDVPETIMSQY